jgi:2-polyprenyl-6-methoxyphenol hydroxylase-like FAD-dependent oxidoreductase
MMLTGVSATVSSQSLEDRRRIVLHGGGGSQISVEARVVLACDGLGSSSLSALPAFRHRVHPHARVGVGAALDGIEDELPRGAIRMCLGESGYVGRVRLSDGRVNVAAALDPGALRTLGPAGAINRILSACGQQELPPQASDRFRGTMPLMRQAQNVAAGRVLLLGDACGYVEPFTGDGMALALETAMAAVPVALAAQEVWTDQLARQWQLTVRRIAASRRVACRALAGLCRSPLATDIALAFATRAPGVFASLVARMDRRPKVFKESHQWECTLSA